MDKNSILNLFCVLAFSLSVLCSVINAKGNKYDLPKSAKKPDMPRGQMNMQPEELKKRDKIAFEKSDTNKDGVITREEVFQTMRTNFIEAKLNEFKQKEDDESVIEKMAIAEANSKVVDMKKTAKEVMKKDDLNKDGQITFDEFVGGRKNHMADFSKREDL